MVTSLIVRFPMFNVLKHLFGEVDASKAYPYTICVVVATDLDYFVDGAGLSALIAERHASI